MDVIHTRPDLVGVAVLFEGVQELHVALGGLDGDDIGVKALDGREDVVKVGVAEVRVSLQSIRDASSAELERINSPFKVAVPINTTKRELKRVYFSTIDNCRLLQYLHPHEWQARRPGWREYQPSPGQ